MATTMVSRLSKAGRSIWSPGRTPDVDLQASRSVRLAETVARCESVLEGIPPALAQAMSTRLRRARTSLDCWNARRALFDLVSQVHGPDEAQKRLAALQRWFAARRPR
jgi:hypothetical protein